MSSVDLKINVFFFTSQPCSCSYVTEKKYQVTIYKLWKAKETKVEIVYNNHIVTDKTFILLISDRFFIFLIFLFRSFFEFLTDNKSLAILVRKKQDLLPLCRSHAIKPRSRDRFRSRLLTMSYDWSFLSYFFFVMNIKIATFRFHDGYEMAQR